MEELKRIRDKIRVIHFWIVAFSVIIWNVLKGRHWHSIRVDFDFGDEDPQTGTPKRKQLIAMRHYDSLDIYWQDLEPLWEAHRGATGD